MNSDLATLRLSGRSPLLSATGPPPQWPLTTINLADLKWATPFDIAVLANIWAQLGAEHAIPKVIPPSDAQVRAYLVGAGLHTVMEGLDVPGGGTGADPPLVRLTHLTESHAWDDLLREIWPTARAVLPDYDTALRTLDIMSELIDNATTHGDSSLGTYVCAQWYAGTTSGLGPGIWVGIADAGVGIPEHLRRNPRYADILSDMELIRLARQPRVTGTADRRGWGLVEVFQSATASGPSDLLIRSGHAEGIFRVREGDRIHARYRPLKQPIVGTWVHVRLAAA